MKPLLFKAGRGLAHYSVVAAIVVLTLLTWQYASQTSRDQSIVSNALNGSFSLIIVCDHDGSVIYANDKLGEVTGYTFKELQAGGVSLIIPPDLERSHAAAFAKAMEAPTYGGVTYSRLIEVCHKSGKRIPAIIAISTASTANGPAAYAFILPISTLTSLCDVASLNCLDKSKK